MASKNAEEKNTAEPANSRSAPTTSHIPAWKIILVVGILLGLMILGGFLMKS